MPRASFLIIVKYCKGCCETSLGTCLPLELIWKTPASPPGHHAFFRLLLKPTGQGMFSFIWKRQVHNGWSMG